MKLELNAAQLEVAATFAATTLQNNIKQRDSFAEKAAAGEKLLRSLSAGSTEFDADEIGALAEVVAMLKMIMTHMPQILQPEKAPAVAEVVRLIEEAQKSAAN